MPIYMLFSTVGTPGKSVAWRKDEQNQVQALFSLPPAPAVSRSVSPKTHLYGFKSKLYTIFHKSEKPFLENIRVYLMVKYQSKSNLNSMHGKNIFCYRRTFLNENM